VVTLLNLRHVNPNSKLAHLEELEVSPQDIEC
jgi:hypothetical protein